MSLKKRAVVLLSGNGTNLQSLMDKQNQYAYEVVGVISNIPDAFGLERARRHQVAATALDHTAFSSRADFDQRLIEEIERFTPDLIILAGYMRILTPPFVEHFKGRTLNIHPSLLPDYKGLNTHQRVLADRQQQHGCTVHFVTPALDSGAQILQAVLKLTPDDDETSLRQRVQAMEHQVYPMAVHLLASGRLTLKDDRAQLDGHPLNRRGYHIEEHALELPWVDGEYDQQCN